MCHFFVFHFLAYKVNRQTDRRTEENKGKKREAEKKNEKERTQGATGGQRVALLYNKRITQQSNNPPTIQMDDGVSSCLIQASASHP